jgi:nicotinate-nucleotide pyrophosphorylase (carboxylating)
MENQEIDPIIDRALEEDMPGGDITSENVIPPDSNSTAVFLTKGEGVLAGMPVVRRVFQKIDASIRFTEWKHDGAFIKSGTKLAILEGNSIALLKGERTALNFLQRMSGIASETRKYVKVLAGTGTKILDTRKTTPGLRILEKYAVKMGGGENHRFSLSDMVMLKDNHLTLVGSIARAVKKARTAVHGHIKIEVETTSLEEVKEALESGADMIMLDNMTMELMEEVVQWVNGRVLLEVSGNVNLKKLKTLADLGVDYISVGSLTHSFKSLDISMDFL